MLRLSKDPDQARREMDALIFYLTTFSYIDGEFDPGEVTFIREVIKEVVEHRIASFGYDPASPQGQALVKKFTSTFNEVLNKAGREVMELLSESVSEAESREEFVTCRLKQRCYESFVVLGPEIRQQLLATVDDLLMADGHAHAAEVAFRQELLELLQGDAEAVTPPSQEVRHQVEVDELTALPHRPTTHDFFDRLERPWSDDAEERREQARAERALIDQAIEVLERQRSAGRGQLADKVRVDELPEGVDFLDDRVKVLAPRSGRRQELTVLGDLHGCYGCLKAALLQSRFFDKLAAYQSDPEGEVEPTLVFLGDYIDRGRYGVEGVLRLALQLFVNAPEQVVMLRGNHEMFVEHEGLVQSVVRPAESVISLWKVGDDELLRSYMRLFEALPTSMLFGRTLLTHGGAPRDAVIKEKVQTLAGLNDENARFQMLWSDPSMAEVIPKSLQDSSYRFGVGRLQLRGFLQRLGCHTLIRGHDRVVEGFRRDVDDEAALAVTVFSAGGDHNDDLPEGSSYRDVRPAALTIEADGGLDDPLRLRPWGIDYDPYNGPKRNRFHRDKG